MLTTLDLLEMLKSANEDCSDYRAAKLLGIHKNTVSMWIHRGSVMDDETGIKAAELLNIDPEYVVLCLHAERAKDGASKKLLERVCRRLEPKKKAA